ncbi:phosphohistidine phosphatase SixA [Chthoniobacter flavus]|uniref:phosphohistidine phosphatase SixA n=1 Tax=Chthoniobacter flavus TaxID=191863 RepID=UPI0010E631EB|nr:phosphohistidine phosphatase SixA [Chthoniobacter flavus]TCO85244.1 phosphohistidine phosphatase SixA [Chthoniobacter flavus]
MLLYLLRHADADTVAASDDARALSEKGIDQAQKVARFCEAHDMQLSLILTSPLRRAHETAKPMAAALRAELMIVPWLASGMHPEAALEELRAYRSQTSVMLVGHEPDFSQLAAHLLGLPTNNAIHVRKGSLTLLELDVFRAGAATLQFSLPCKLM